MYFCYPRTTRIPNRLKYSIIKKILRSVNEEENNEQEEIDRKEREREVREREREEEEGWETRLAHRP